MAAFERRVHTLSSTDEGLRLASPQGPLTAADAEAHLLAASQLTSSQNLCQVTEDTEAPNCSEPGRVETSPQKNSVMKQFGKAAFSEVFSETVGLHGAILTMHGTDTESFA